MEIINPKDKALELVEKFKKETSYEYQEYTGAHYSIFELDIDVLKKCALILVDECINSTQFNVQQRFSTEFWLEVKQELEK